MAQITQTGPVARPLCLWLARPTCGVTAIGARISHVRPSIPNRPTTEILGAIGLILPALLDIAPVLVPLAAVGLGLIMTGAAIVEFRRQEFKHVLLNLTYLGLAAFVAFGRLRP